jgi:dephospho-CoA kinase
MRLEDATARIRAQVPELERIAIADFVVRNEGGADELPSLAGEALASLLGR